MATKAEEYRYWTERSGPKKPKAPPRARRDVPVDTSRPGVSATDRKAGAGGSASRRAGEKALFALETSETRPSRKSTRRAKNRQRTDAKMRQQARASEARPRPKGASR